MPDSPVPIDAKRILLINPTKYLGNLLIAGGLMQDYARHCQQQGIALKILIDESFQELCEGSFPTGTLLFFPRRRINQAGVIGKLLLLRKTVRELRKFHADLAFNIEEDSATSHLTRLSGAQIKMGCSLKKHKTGYDYVVPVEFENRPSGEEHRWYSFLEVFKKAGLPDTQEPGYIRLQQPGIEEDLRFRLSDYGVDFSRPLIAIHASATKTYKQWPLTHFIALCLLILEHDMQPVLLGAGTEDRLTNEAVMAALEETHTEKPAVNLCDKLSLAELPNLLLACKHFIGNDSGPFHLCSALGLAGSVIWGPTNAAIWGPLGEKSNIMKSDFHCDPACSKGHCLHEYQCLKELSPQKVFNSIL